MAKPANPDTQRIPAPNTPAQSEETAGSVDLATPPSPAVEAEPLALARLIDFFQLLDRWDREANTNPNSQEKHM